METFHQPRLLRRLELTSEVKPIARVHDGDIGELSLQEAVYLGRSRVLVHAGGDDVLARLAPSECVAPTTASDAIIWSALFVLALAAPVLWLRRSRAAYRKVTQERASAASVTKQAQLRRLSKKKASKKYTRWENT